MKSTLTKKNFDNLLEDEEFYQLEEIQRRFNIFRAAGLTKQEIKHSNFLAELLSPAGHHGMGDLFLRQFLLELARSRSDDKFTPSDVMLGEWQDMRVEREKENIDLLLTSRAAGFMCSIENKVASREQYGQLERYRKRLEKLYDAKSYPRRFHLLLSPDGKEPSSVHYAPMGYRAVISAVGKVLESASVQGNAGLKLILEHYLELLRSEVMQHDELVRLCQRIYQKHRRALDAIWENRGADIGRAITSRVKQLIERDSAAFSLAPDASGSSIIRFADATLDSKPWMHKSEGDWTDSKRVILFEFTRRPDSLRLELVLGDAPSRLRSKIIAACNAAPFTNASKVNKWHRLWWEEILSTQDFADRRVGDLTHDDFVGKLEAHWENFLHKTLPALRATLSHID